MNEGANLCFKSRELPLLCRESRTLKYCCRSFSLLWALIPSPPVYPERLYTRQYLWTLFSIFCMFSSARCPANIGLLQKSRSVLSHSFTCVHLNKYSHSQAACVLAPLEMVRERPPLASGLGPVVLVRTRVRLLHSQLPKQKAPEFNLNGLNIGLWKRPERLGIQKLVMQKLSRRQKALTSTSDRDCVHL